MSDRPLREDGKQKIRNALSQRSVADDCNLCETGTLQLFGQLVSIQAIKRGGFSAVALICSNCGNAVFLSISALGFPDLHELIE